ncbi:MAG: hypothetical protein IPG92_15605 [Flavobacteriales bacterium]|nr:hypothetical protein [Flavobacteriales bacterium]
MGSRRVRKRVFHTGGEGIRSTQGNEGRNGAEGGIREAAIRGGAFVQYASLQALAMVGLTYAALLPVMETPDVVGQRTVITVAVSRPV